MDDARCRTKVFRWPQNITYRFCGDKVKEFALCDPLATTLIPLLSIQCIPTLEMFVNKVQNQWFLRTCLIKTKNITLLLNYIFTIKYITRPHRSFHAKNQYSYSTFFGLQLIVDTMWMQIISNNVSIFKLQTCSINIIIIR